MSDYAGYAVAVTIHTQVFDDQFRSAWNNRQIKHWARGSFGQVPDAVGNVNLFYQSPQVICSDNNQIQAILRLNGWGTITVRPALPGVFETRSVQWQADILITPTASSIASVVLLSAPAMTFRLIAWQFDVVSGGAFSAAAEGFLTGDIFKADLLGVLQQAVGDINVPIMNFTALGPFGASSFTNVALKIAGTGILIGLDMDNGVFATSGDRTQLKDIAGTNDVGIVVNPGAILPLMPQLRQQIQAQIPTDSTLNSLSIGCEEGQLRVKGSASNNYGTANFSLAAVPVMSTAIAGGIFPVTEKKTITIPARSWPALSFRPADVSVDVDQAAWIDKWVIIGGILTLGAGAFLDQLMIWQAEDDVSLGIQTSDLNPNGATPLVQRTGSPPTRFAIQDFEIHTVGLYIGISSKLEVPRPSLSGVKSIAVNYVSQNIPFSVALPFDALQDDPFLHIRWTVVDLDSGNTLVNSDAVALNRLSFQFIPSSVGPTTTRFAVACRVYRALGALTNDLFNETIRMSVGPALPHHAYTRWYYQVKNPQFHLLNTDNTEAKWHLTGQLTLQRHSRIHRLDKPCRNALHSSRFTSNEVFWDALPFPVAMINAHRDSLCDYCFFGGPGSTIASL